MANTVLESEENASAAGLPTGGLGGETPLEYAETEVGARKWKTCLAASNTDLS